MTTEIKLEEQILLAIRKAKLTNQDWKEVQKDRER